MPLLVECAALLASGPLFLPARLEPTPGRPLAPLCVPFRPPGNAFAEPIRARIVERLISVSDFRKNAARAPWWLPVCTLRLRAQCYITNRMCILLVVLAGSSRGPEHAPGLTSCYP